ncbi:MAG TPA: methylated-DNA--[protein]-cysteine S-methyltransferase [Candidatus Methylomirabilis sp.]|nr:methylated-DNA--[protein]-cysteine S-methyltransferase [Candidatus Methylomirabilis sp.]
MTDKPKVCVQIEDDLLAAAMGEAAPGAAQRVDHHLAACASCRREFQEYRAVDSAVTTLREEQIPTGTLALAREQLDTRLADLRRRLLTYQIFPSPLGHILIARSELGISLVEYLERGTSLRASRLRHEPGVELVESGGELEATYRELLEYLDGRRKRLDWPLDLRLARSDFQRTVLQATAAIPYGAVIPYAGIAHGVGRAAAVRAVAQALRWNPLPIVIPCHRVIGTSGSLTGYAGGKVDLKQKLLCVEGIPIARKAGVLGITPQAMYALYPGDREYCLPTCPSFSTHRPLPLTRFASREFAEAAGFAPCTTCRPDLHPISR